MAKYKIGSDGRKYFVLKNNVALTLPYSDGTHMRVEFNRMQDAAEYIKIVKNLIKEGYR